MEALRVALATHLVQPSVVASHSGLSVLAIVLVLASGSDAHLVWHLPLWWPIEFARSHSRLVEACRAHDSRLGVLPAHKV